MDIHREDVPGDVLVFLTGRAVVLTVRGCEGVRGWRGPGEGRDGATRTKLACKLFIFVCGMRGGGRPLVQVSAVVLMCSPKRRAALVELYG